MAFREVILYRVQSFLSPPPRIDINFRHSSSCDTVVIKVDRKWLYIYIYIYIEEGTCGILKPHPLKENTPDDEKAHNQS